MPTAKNHPPLISSVSPRFSVCLWSLLWVLTCNQALAEPVANDDDTPPVAQQADDTASAAAPPASQRLAAEARRLLANIDAAPRSVWLDIDGKEVLAFWQEDMSGAPKGAVLLLHAEGHSPRWPDTLLNLHQTLPRFGWATLSVELPAPAALTLPPRPPTPAKAPPPAAAEDATEPKEADAADSQPSTIDETQVVHQEENAVSPEEQPEPPPLPPTPSAEEIEQATINTIQAALDYLQQQNQTTIVIFGEGLGAARALKFATQVPSPPVNALVMLDATLDANGDTTREENVSDATAQLLQRPDVPTLDLITSVNFEVRRRAAKRKQVSKKMQYETYLVRNILPQVGIRDRDEETDLSKTVRGFITKYAESPEQ